MADVVKVTLNGTTLIDHSDATVEPDKVLSSYVGYEGDGDRFTGTYVAPSAITVSAFTTTSNGIFTAPSGYAYSPVTVSVSGGSGDSKENEIVMRTISGMYVNNDVSAIGSYAFAYCVSLTSVNLANCECISDHAFFECNNLETVAFSSSCSYIGSYAFSGCRKLDGVSFPNCYSISMYAFNTCINMKYAYFQNCSHIDTNAFNGCSSLTSVSFPNCVTISTNCFRQCYSLESVFLPNCERIGASAFMFAGLRNISLPACAYMESSVFMNCSKLENIYLPVCGTVGINAFANCSNMSYADLPVLTNLVASCFMNCYRLESISIPMCSRINASAFWKCSGLLSVILPSVNSIYANAFLSCANLYSVYLLSTSLVSLANVNAFGSTPISVSSGGVYGSIFVRASLYDAFISATNWLLYSSRIVSLTDAEIEALG